MINCRNSRHRSSCPGVISSMLQRNCGNSIMTQQAKILEYLDGGILCEGFYYTPEDVTGPLQAAACAARDQA